LHELTGDGDVCFRLIMPAFRAADQVYISRPPATSWAPMPTFVSDVFISNLSDEPVDVFRDLCHRKHGIYRRADSVSEKC